MSLPTELAPNLLSPVTLGDMELRNRVVMAPLTRGRAEDDRTPNDLMVDYYSQRAEHTGLIITEASGISGGFGANGWVKAPGMYTDSHVEGWKKVVDAVHEKGCKIVFQMWHMGRAAHSSYHDGKQIVAPSPITAQGDGVYAANGEKVPYEEPRALELEEIPLLVEEYRKSAELCKAAGFDGIEIHSANGYLLDEFLQSHSNKRDDAYGGSLENRMRLLNEVLDAVLTVLPAGQVGVRLSPNGVYNDMGSEDNIETFTYALQQLDTRGLAYVHVMSGLSFGFHQKCEAFTIEAMREVFKGKLIANCGFTRDTAEATIAAGSADAVAFGRLFIGNPDLAYRFAHDLPLVESNPATWFSHDAEGYNDYPAYTPSEEEAKA